MSRKAQFIPFRPKTILNQHKQADHWFWTRYSAYPYIGCQHGCESCYCRERKYSPYEDPLDFAYVIMVKENAPELLRRALSRLPAVVAFSAITTPNSEHYERVRKMEHLSPAPEERFRAMQKFAEAGIPTGTCLLPILPGLCDDDANLENVVRWTAEHGGQFVLAGGLTLADQQRDYFFGILSERFPDLLGLYQSLYPPGIYGPGQKEQWRIARQVREFCNRYGIRDRIPRAVISGDKRTLNKHIVEALANQVYDLELDEQPANRVWAYRKAAWAIEDLEQDIGLIYKQLGIRGLQSITDVGPKLASRVEELILEIGCSKVQG